MKVAVFTVEPTEVTVSAECDWFPLDTLAEEKEGVEQSRVELSGYEAVLVIGSSSLDEGTPLPKGAADKLWRYAEAGGRLYAEMIDAYDFPSSRLFGWKQDFPRTRRTLEKLRMEAESEALPRGGLLEWEGAMAYGFPIETESWLTFGPYRETHASPSDTPGSHPGLFVRTLGEGIVAYAAFSLFSCRRKWALRPYGSWSALLDAFAARTGIPFRIWAQPIATSGDESADRAVRDNASWFLRSGMLPEADGSAGVYENIHSVTAAVSADRRPDCHAHAALFFHLYGRYTGSEEWESRSRRLLAYLFDNGFQDTEESSPTRGFFKWYDFPGRKPEQIFTDDNAWVCFVLLYLYRKTGLEQYRERGLMTAEALLETQNAQGLRPNVLFGSRLREAGRGSAFELEASLNPHFESIAHAAFIQAYLVTGRNEYVDAALKGTLHLLRHEDELRFMYSRTSGLTRLLLPLGYLSKRDATGEVARGMERIASYLMTWRDASGAIQEADNPDPERFGKEDAGVYIHNGEGIADQLYTNNFLLMNSWEAYKATGSEELGELYRGLSAYMSRIRIRSAEPRFNGGWMRAYDLRRGEYYGNNGDTGWGPYCMESGWTNAIASAGLLLGLMNESIFE
ncbi:hypothetical protein [Paenibacillus flagellatus]|uniref:Uncharacterized protein n=1 Tax=Paenibacillus flagellatus TaxID=2211139 RepID=A0A2V5JXK1_9BACL|nr:hypothetical protein [Paenibacillus flagellatus]PYI51585.1 hypothetical protein DLM86_24545 [Paenibacillus flagellatus]